MKLHGISRTTGVVTMLILALQAVQVSVAQVQAVQGQVETDEDVLHRSEVESWRAKRHKQLSSPTGWLTLVGLEWLSDGENRIGSAVDNDIRIPGGPAYWGSVSLTDGQLFFVRSAEGITINGQACTSEPVALIPDTQGEPTVVASGRLSFQVIHRGSFGLRIKDSQALSLRDFSGVNNYPIESGWRIEGLFEQAPEGSTLEIANVLGQIIPLSMFGTFVFEKGGKTHRLLAIGKASSSKLWFIFADRTNGRETYGAGRYLYSDGMPNGDRLVVDFNKAYNPPCAFNDYSTCPVPPQENRLDLLVSAGEKEFHSGAY